MNMILDKKGSIFSDEGRNGANGKPKGKNNGKIHEVQFDYQKTNFNQAASPM